MCDSCQPATALPPFTRRRKIWELEGGWHCSIVGTCITIGELRGLAKKLKLRAKPDFPEDYQYHGHFASNVSTAGKEAKLLNKILDKKHHISIKKIAPLECARALEAFWETSLNLGEIPGPFWAILTHPFVTLSLSERLFADVHMLSHLVGAANRADIRSLKEMEAENTLLLEKLTRHNRRTSERISAKDLKIASLREQVQRLKQVQPSQTARPTPTVLDRTVEKSSAYMAQLRQQCDDLKASLDDTRLDSYQLSAVVETLKSELSAMESAFDFDLETNTVRSQTVCPVNLEGQCILYVGGRPSYICRLRTLVNDWNGEFIHHDGGLEKSIDELARAVVRADTVVFPTDQISHSAVHKVKQLCRQTQKPYVPLRTDGVASFVAGFQESAIYPSAAPVRPGT